MPDGARQAARIHCLPHPSGRFSGKPRRNRIHATPSESAEIHHGVRFSVNRAVEGAPMQRSGERRFDLPFGQLFEGGTQREAR
ncbi:MAG TPA: hypothetical protein PLO53_10085, partial [Candidatus Hydrogenedentes bacterium]|nr:hypothetical protein [Candidatus Hydrogenedentota bacterium]